MKFICTTEHLQNAVVATERFTGKHITLPILSYIKIQAQGGEIILSATNLEVGMERSIPGKVIKPGVMTAPARLLTQSIQSLEEETVAVEGVKQNVTLNTPSSTITLNSLNPSDFPSLPQIKQEYTFSVEADTFLASLKQVAPAVATGDLKPELAGVVLRRTPTATTLAATDSFRLAEKTIPQQEQGNDAVTCILPRATAQELIRAVPEGDDLSVTIGEHQILFEWRATKVLSRLIDGAFPPYENLFPRHFETTVTTSRSDLTKRVRLAAVFSSRLSDVTVEFSGSELAVRAENTEAGGTTARLPATTAGKSGSVMFNYRYLLDGLEAMHGETIVLRLNGSAGPTLIEDPGDRRFRYLIMPIRSV